jgi:multidrug efflux pump subunit AcrA (membrane-fusion protein)
MFKQIIKIVAIVGICSNHLWVYATAAPDNYVVRNFAVGTAITLSGTVIPFKEVTLSAQLPGRVEVIAGEEGDHFAKDTVLVALDDTELLAQRRAAVAGLMNAEAALRHAGIQYERELYSPNSPDKAPGGMGLPHLFDQFFTKPMSDMTGESEDGLDRRASLHGYSTQIRQARGELLRAQSQIEQIDAKLRDAVGKAPFEGVITKKVVEVGDTAQPGQPLLKFANLDRLQIEVDVPARLVRGLKVGDTVIAKLDADNSPIQVKVAQVFPIADPQRHTVKIKLDIPKLPEGIRTGPGQYVQVEIPDNTTVELQSLPVIPRQAVIWRGSLPGVYVIKDDKRELRLLRLGNEIDPSLIGNASLPFNNLVTVLSGLKEGEIIELNPAPGTAAGWTNKKN